MLKLLPAVVVAALLIGCRSDDPPPIIPETPPVTTKGVLIANEGGFGSSNSSLTLYVPDSSKVYADVFFSENNRALGDVANDLVLWNSKAFIVVQNSHKIEVISATTYKSIGTLPLPAKTPNKIVIVSDTKAYVTNLYKASVTSFNPTTLAIIKDSIAVGQNPQSMVYAGGKVFVCNSGYGSDNTISVINPANDSVVAKIFVGKGPTDISVDSDGDIIVVCTGYSDFAAPINDTPGNISVINASTNTVTATIALPLTTYGHPSELAVSKNGYGYTIGKNGVVKFDTKTNTIVSATFIPKSFYSIAVDDSKELLYGGDAKNFSQNGTVYIYEKTGVMKDSITVGIIPGTFAFKK